MLAGGVVYLLSHRIALSESGRRATELAGFALIVASIFLFSAKTVWPGAWAMVPVVGAVLVLVAARPKSAWTDTRIAQWLGTRSYSLYLWHWPIVVALAYLTLQHSAVAVAAGLALTMVLGELSYLFVETTARLRLQQWKFSAVAAALLAASFLLAVPAALVRLQDGVRGRLAPNIEAAFDEMNNKNPRITECMVLGPKPVPNCALTGGLSLGRSWWATVTPLPSCARWKKRFPTNGCMCWTGA